MDDEHKILLRIAGLFILAGALGLSFVKHPLIGMVAIPIMTIIGVRLMPFEK